MRFRPKQQRRHVKQIHHISEVLDKTASQIPCTEAVQAVDRCTHLDDILIRLSQSARARPFPRDTPHSGRLSLPLLGRV